VPGTPGMMVYPKIAHEVMPMRAIFMLRSLRLSVVAVTLKIRSSQTDPFTDSINKTKKASFISWAETKEAPCGKKAR